MKIFTKLIFIWIVSNVSVHLNAYQLILPKTIMKCLKKQAISCNIMGKNEKSVIMYITNGQGCIFIDAYENLLKSRKITYKLLKPNVISDLKYHCLLHFSAYVEQGEQESCLIEHERSYLAYCVYFLVIQKFEMDAIEWLYASSCLIKLFTNLKKPDYAKHIALLFEKSLKEVD